MNSQTPSFLKRRMWRHDTLIPSQVSSKRTDPHSRFHMNVALALEASESRRKTRRRPLCQGNGLIEDARCFGVCEVALSLTGSTKLTTQLQTGDERFCGRMRVCMLADGRDVRSPIYLRMTSGRIRMAVFAAPIWIPARCTGGGESPATSWFGLFGEGHPLRPPLVVQRWICGGPCLRLLIFWRGAPAALSLPCRRACTGAHVLTVALPAGASRLALGAWALACMTFPASVTRAA